MALEPKPQEIRLRHINESLSEAIRYFDPDRWYEHRLLMLQMKDMIDELVSQRDDAREQEERFSDDALRLMEERNQALKERDEARREVAQSQAQYNSLMFDNSRLHDPHAIAESRGWDCFKKV